MNEGLGGSCCRCGVHAYLKVPDQSIVKVIDPAMNGELLIAFPGAHDGWEVLQDANLLNNVQLAKPPPARIISRE